MEVLCGGDAQELLLVPEMAFEFRDHRFGIKVRRPFQQPFREAQVVVLDTIVFASSDGKVKTSVDPTFTGPELVSDQRLER